jgi:hypothetical protein
VDWADFPLSVADQAAVAAWADFLRSAVEVVSHRSAAALDFLRSVAAPPEVVLVRSHLSAAAVNKKLQPRCPLTKLTGFSFFLCVGLGGLSSLGGGASKGLGGLSSLGGGAGKLSALKGLGGIGR